MASTGGLDHRCRVVDTHVVPRPASQRVCRATTADPYVENISAICEIRVDQQTLTRHQALAPSELVHNVDAFIDLAVLHIDRRRRLARTTRTARPHSLRLRLCAVPPGAVSHPKFFIAMRPNRGPWPT